MIIHGRKVVRKKRGMVGWFCPICCEPTYFRVTSVSTVPHIYFIPIAFQTPVNCELHCEKCCVVLSAAFEVKDRAKNPRDIVGVDPLVLASQTLPYPEAKLAARVDLEERVKADLLEPEDLLAAWTEPFEAMRYYFETKAHTGARESIIAVGVFLLMVLGFVVPVLTYEWWLEPHPELWFTACVFVSWVVLLAVLGLDIRLIRSQRKYAAQHFMLRHIAKIIVRLRPSNNQVEQMLMTLRLQGLPLAQLIAADDLWREIERVRASRTPGPP